MAMNYVDTSKRIIDAVGGVDNISSVQHCATRLRLRLKDEGKADDDKVRGIEGVKGVSKYGSQYQIIVGGEAENLCKQFIKFANFSGDNALTYEKSNESLIQRLINFISGCMMPLIPILCGGGIVKLILITLTMAGLMSEDGATYKLLFSLADGCFYFMPVFLGWSIAVKVGGSIPLYMALGACLLYPDMVAIMSGVTQGYEAVISGTFLGQSCTYLFGFLPVIKATYSSTLVPMLLMAPIMKKVEDFADRLSRNALNVMLKPLIFFSICLPILLVVIGPFSSVISSFLVGIVSWLYNTVPWLTVGILSAVMPFLVITGTQHAINHLSLLYMSTMGFDPLIGTAHFCANICQGGAAFGVATKTKNKEIRATGISGGITATIGGITEPAIYGINLRFKKPLIAVVVGAGISGLLAGFVGIKFYVMTWICSFLSLPAFLGGDNPYQAVIWAGICGVVGLVVSFVLSFILYKDEDSAVKDATVAKSRSKK